MWCVCVCVCVWVWSDGVIVCGVCVCACVWVWSDGVIVVVCVCVCVCVCELYLCMREVQSMCRLLCRWPPATLKERNRDDS